MNLKVCDAIMYIYALLVQLSSLAGINGLYGNIDAVNMHTSIGHLFWKIGDLVEILMDILFDFFMIRAWSGLC